MKNLANIQSAIADTLARVELFRAGITAFRVRTSDGSGKTAVVGLMEFDGGTDVLFVRGDKGWTARITGSRQNGSTGTTTKVVSEGYRTAIHSRQLDYACYSLKALDAFQEDLSEKFQYQDRGDSYAEGVRTEPCDLLRGFGFDPESLKVLHPPRGDSHLINMEIQALKAYGREKNNLVDTILCEEESLDVAVAWHRWRDPICARLASQLCKLLRDEISRSQQLLDVFSPYHPDRVKLLASLEWLLMRKLPLVERLRRKKDITSMQRKLQLVRIDLLATCHGAIQRRNTLADDKSPPTTAVQRQEAAYIAAHNFAMLRDVSARMDLGHASRCYEQQRDE